MFRLLQNGTVVRIRPASSSSRSLISRSRSIQTAPGFLSELLKARRKMAKVVPQTRPLSETDLDPAQVATSAEKKPRTQMDVEPSEQQPVASSSTGATTEQKQPNRKTQPKKTSKRRKQKRLLPEPYSREDVVWRDVRELLGADVADGVIKEGNDWESPFQHGEELQVEVSAISSTGTPTHRSFSARTQLCHSSGDGLAIAPSPKPPWVVVVPFALPGEVARVKIHQSRRLHSISCLLEIETPNPTLRDDSRIKCRYFGVCAGCQYQVSCVRIQSSLVLTRLIPGSNYRTIPNSTSRGMSSSRLIGIFQV